MTRKKAIALFLFPFLFSSCHKAEENTLIIIDNPNMNEDISSKPESLITSIVGDLIFSPLLYEVGSLLTPHNVLIREVKILPGNRVIEIRLKEGIRFHDGKKFTAIDIPPAVDKLREDLAVRYGELFKNLSVEVIDKTSFRLINPSPMFDVNMVLAGIYAYPAELSGKLTGTGPFKISQWLDNGVELVANKAYFEGAPKLKKIIYLHEENERKRLYKLLKGEADLMIFLSPDAARFLEKDKRFYVKKISSWMYSAIIFNNSSPFFADKTIRNAVSMAIDRDDLIEKGIKGAGARILGPFSMVQSQGTSSKEYRPKEAMRLLKEAGWRYGDKGSFLEKNNKGLGFSLYYTKGIEDFKKVVDVISQQLFEVGIKVVGIPINHDEFMKEIFGSHDYGAYLSTFNSSDYYNFIHWHSLSKTNFSRFNNADVDRLLMEMRENVEIKEKKVIYGRLQEIFNEEAPAAFLYNNVIYTAVNKRFNGAEDFTGEIYKVYKIKDWSVNENFR